MAMREGRNRLSEEVKVMEGLGYLCESKGLCIDSKLGCGEWEALTSFDKNKQIRLEGNVQAGAPVNLNSKTLKSTMSASNNRG